MFSHVDSISTVRSNEFKTQEAFREVELAPDGWALVAWLLTFARLPLLLATISLLQASQMAGLASIAILGIMIADILDGQAMNQSRRCSKRVRLLRHAIDAVADRLVIQSVLVACLLTGVVPLNIVLFLIGRELFLVVIVLRPYLSNGTILAADNFSKCGTVLLAAVVLNELVPFVPTTSLLILFGIVSLLGFYRYQFHPRRFT